MKVLLLILSFVLFAVTGCSDERFNFRYTDGDQPWLDLKSSDIYATAEAKAYAEIWKLAFQTRNGMSEEYFDAHIAVVATGVREKMVGPKRLRQFWIGFYYHVDWARIRLKDQFVISLDGGCDITTLDDVMAFVEKDDVHLICGATARISWVKPVEHIATKDQVRKAVKEVSPLLRLNVNNLIRLDRNGLLECDLHGIVDWEANKCIRATITLADASVSEPEPTACRVY